MNTLAVLRETAGLLLDLMRLKPDAAGPHRERFQRGLATIQKHVLRGMQLGEHLNAFAHRLDQPKTDFDLHDLLDHVAFFLQRPAEMKNLLLHRPPHTQPIPMQANPFLVQLVVTACAEHGLKNAPQNATLSLLASSLGEHIAISLVLDPHAPLTPTPDLEALLPLLGTSASLHPTATGLTLRLEYSN